MDIIRDVLSGFYVEKLLIPLNQLPIASFDHSYIKISELLCNYNLGIVFISDEKKLLRGIITDGDVRRAFKKHGPLPLFTLDASHIATKNPQYCYQSTSLFDALNIMESNKKIMCLPVIDNERKLCGAITLHSIISFILSLR